MSTDTPRDPVVAEALGRIEERLKSGDKRFDEIARSVAEHVKECTEEKRTVVAKISMLAGQTLVVRNLVVALMALVGSSIVAAAILLRD